jgi:hypothetical protein
MLQVQQVDDEGTRPDLYENQDGAGSKLRAATSQEAIAAARPNIRQTPTDVPGFVEERSGLKAFFRGVAAALHGPPGLKTRRRLQTSSLPVIRLVWPFILW